MTHPHTITEESTVAKYSVINIKRVTIYKIFRGQQFLKGSIYVLELYKKIYMLL